MQRFRASLDHSNAMSNFILEFLDKLVAESTKLQNHTNAVHEAHTISIADFQKAYEV